jgi:N-acyl-L-homoserine lactone synthetase
MYRVTFGLHSMHQHGRAFYDFLQLRKRFFVDTLKWDVPHNDVVEMDQYDNPVARYSVVLRAGEVVGGARIMPLDARWGSHGSMLADAAEGLIPGIPAESLPDLASHRSAAECTRLVLSDTIGSGADRTACLALVVEGLVDLATEFETTEMVTLTVPTLRRVLRSLGYDVQQLGHQFWSPEDGRTYTVLRMPTRHAMRETTETEVPRATSKV